MNPNLVAHYADLPALPFFVYGTLKKGQANHNFFPSDAVEDVLPAKTYSARFMLYGKSNSSYPVAVRLWPSRSYLPGEVIPSGNSIIGELVYIKSDADYCDVMQKLDLLEQGYSRIKVIVCPERREIDDPAEPMPLVLAWMYVASNNWEYTVRSTWKRVPGGEWDPTKIIIPEEIVVSPTVP